MSNPYKKVTGRKNNPLVYCNMKRLVLVCILGILLTGCMFYTTKEVHKTIYTIIAIPPEVSGKVLKMSEVYDSLCYVPLETNDNFLIGEVDRLIPLADRIVVVDKNVAKAVYVFDKQGGFLNQIGALGAGAREYAGIASVSVDENNNVYIYDNSRNKLLIYTITGNYTGELSVPFFAQEIECLGNDEMIFYCDYAVNPAFTKEHTTPNSVVFNLKTKECTPFLYVNDQIKSNEIIVPTLPVIKNEKGNEVSLFYPLSRYIYSISPTEITGGYRVNFGETNEERKNAYIKRLIEEDLPVCEENNAMPDFCDLTKCLLLNDGVYIEYIDYSASKLGCGYYFNDLNIYRGGEQIGKFPLENDLDHAWIFSPLCVKNGIVYGVIDAEGLDLIGDTTSEQVNRMKKMKSAEDNPIVVLAYRKKQNVY